MEQLFTNARWQEALGRESFAVNQVIERFISSAVVEHLQQKKRTFAQSSMEMLQLSERKKEDQAKKIQTELMEQIASMSEGAFNRKIRLSVVYEHLVREQRNQAHKLQKGVLMWRGAWRDKELFDRRPESLPLKACSFVAPDHTKPYLKARLEESLIHVRPKVKIFKRELEEEREEAADEREEEEDDELRVFSRGMLRHKSANLKSDLVKYLKAMHNLGRKKEKEIADYKVQLVKPFVIRNGVVILTNFEVRFYDDFSALSEGGHKRESVSFFSYKKEEHQLLHKIWPIKHVTDIYRRRFLLRNSALELILAHNKTVLLNFEPPDERQAFCKNLLRHRNKKDSMLRHYDTLEPKRILKKSQLHENWAHWKTSNFEYLMQVNALSGRSFSDLSQYPVMPWIFVNTEAPHFEYKGGFLRDLSRNMGLLGSPERLAEFKRKYEEAEFLEDLNDRFHYGSHYSNPGIVLQYLVRVIPYTDANVELQGGRLDVADRIFFSIRRSLEHALNEIQDVRELIPEMFFLPELYLNKNGISFGVTQERKEVSDVELPRWAEGDAYRFTCMLREMMESDYVSEHIHLWLDYIFGFKQTGKEAEKAVNKYPLITYEDGVKLEHVGNEKMKTTYEIQSYNYGQTPSQMFAKPHAARAPKGIAFPYSLVTDRWAELKVYKPIQSSSKNTGSRESRITNKAVVKTKFISQNKIAGISRDGTFSLHMWLPQAHDLNPKMPFTCGSEREKKLSSNFKTREAGIEGLDTSVRFYDFPILIFSSGKYIARGGFWDGKITIFPVEKESPVVTYMPHHATVTCIVTEQRERLVITASKAGDVIVWNVEEHEQHWTIYRHFYDHEAMVTSLFVNEDLGMFASSSLDGSVNLYSLFGAKILRSFFHPQRFPLHSVVISSTPLASVAF